MPDAAQLQRLLSPLPQLSFIPVRHHSPRCAWHLQQYLASHKPAYVLIEGPQEMNQLLPMLQQADAQPPLAGFLYHRSPAQDQGQQQSLSRVYIPLAEFSPEWVALRHAADHQATARFIDQPFESQLDADTDDRYSLVPEPMLPDEPSQQAPHAIEQLIRQSDCRDFDEWWDRHFESGVHPKTDDDYFASLLGFSLLLRADGDSPHNRAREQFMAQEIRQTLAAASSDQHCVVICGGFHVSGILQYMSDLLPEDVLAALASDAAITSASSEKRKGTASNISAHLIPYSLQRLSNAHGYGAGIPDPGYYQQVWRNWQGQTANKPKPSPWQKSWPTLAAELASSLRQQGLAVTLPDAMEANRMAHQLGQLRGYHGGRSEIIEAMQATMIREDSEQSLFFSTLKQQLAPQRLGKLPGNASQSPLEKDMQTFCERYRLPDRPMPTLQRNLDIYRHNKHRQQSQGLHRLVFLGVPYGEREFGPDFVQGSDLNRVRERWNLSWTIETRTALIEAGRYGDTIAEACSRKLLQELKSCHDSPARLVLHLLVMGLEELANPVLDAVEQWLSSSLEPLPLAQSCCLLAQAYEAHQVLAMNQQPRLLPLLQQAWNQTCLHLPACGSGDSHYNQKLLAAITDLYDMSRRQAPWANTSRLQEACETLQQRNAAASVHGICAAVLAMSNHWQSDQVEAALAEQLGLCLIDSPRMGDYLQGFLRLASSWLIHHPPTLQRLTGLIRCWDEHHFLEALPALRLAFSQLSHQQLAELGEALVQLNISVNTPPPAQQSHQLLDDKQHQCSQDLYLKTRALLQQWGMLS
jgi:hypothetical protein